VSKHILVVEPARIIRHILGVHLQLAGHTVMEFSTYGLARGAIPLFEHHPPDLVFVALHLAQPESYGVLKSARAHYRDAVLVALVLLEEYAHHAMQTAQQETRAVALIKPFKIQDALALCASGQFPPQQGARDK